MKFNRSDTLIYNLPHTISALEVPAVWGNYIISLSDCIGTRWMCA